MGETTTIIRRRLHHWRTTVAGLCIWLAGPAMLIWPQYAAKISAVAFALAGTGLIAAPDSQNTDPK